MTSKTELNFPKINDIGSWDLESQMEVKQEVNHSNRYFGNIKKKIIATIAAVVILCFASGLFIMIIQDDNRNMRKFFNGQNYRPDASKALKGIKLSGRGHGRMAMLAKMRERQELLAQREAKKAAPAAKNNLPKGQEMMKELAEVEAEEKAEDAQAKAVSEQSSEKESDNLEKEAATEVAEKKVTVVDKAHEKSEKVENEASMKEKRERLNKKHLRRPQRRPKPKSMTDAKRKEWALKQASRMNTRRIQRPENH